MDISSCLITFHAGSIASRRSAGASGKGAGASGCWRLGPARTAASGRCCVMSGDPTHGYCTRLTHRLGAGAMRASSRCGGASAAHGRLNRVPENQGCQEQDRGGLQRAGAHSCIARLEWMVESHQTPRIGQPRCRIDALQGLSTSNDGSVGFYIAQDSVKIGCAPPPVQRPRPLLPLANPATWRQHGAQATERTLSVDH